MVAGSTLIQTGQLLPEAFLAGIPLGFLIAAVVYVNEFPDHDSDKATEEQGIIPDDYLKQLYEKSKKGTPTPKKKISKDPGLRVILGGNVL